VLILSYALTAVSRNLRRVFWVIFLFNLADKLADITANMDGVFAALALGFMSGWLASRHRLKFTLFSRRWCWRELVPAASGLWLIPLVCRAIEVNVGRIDCIAVVVVGLLFALCGRYLAVRGMEVVCIQD
jgi:hypothetical protein